MTRTGDKAVITCHSTAQRWHIVCQGSVWYGKVDNCTSSKQLLLTVFSNMSYLLFITHLNIVWLGDVVVKALRVRIPATPPSGNDSAQVVHTHTHARARARTHIHVVLLSRDYNCDSTAIRLRYDYDTTTTKN